MNKISIIFVFITLLGLPKLMEAQPGNLIFNGNFEQWDTSKYPLADLGDTRLCIDYNGALNNESVGAWSVKNVECLRWLNYASSITGKYKTQASPGGIIPCSYKVCYPQEYLTTFANDLPLKGSETFLGFSFNYDTVKSKYIGGKFFFNMKLAKPLQKGKTYRLDFDICTDGSSYNITPKCPNVSLFFPGTTGFFIVIAAIGFKFWLNIFWPLFKQTYI
jgi:hypothetical protein